MKKTIIALSILTLLSGCAITHHDRVEAPVVTTSMMQKEFDTIPDPASGKPVSVAVYSFSDKTGQRRPQANIASLSTAVTQGAESFLIKALQDVGRGQWFDVVERVGIDNLTKERLIIRQMREAYEGKDAKPLMPMQFAGMIIEGGIIGYDTSTKSGGIGARWLGIGAQTQYSEDIVTVSLRAVSVNTGKVLISVTVQKTILSSADSMTALKFFDAGTKAFEGELGMTINEPGTYAVKSAIEASVVELIKEGQRKGIWDFRTASTADSSPKIAPITKELKVEEEKKDVVVHSQTPQTSTVDKEPTPPIPQQSNGGESSNRDKTESKVDGKEEKLEDNKPNESKIAQATAKPVFGERKLKEGSYLYATESETSTKKWWFPKGSILSIRQPGTDGWWRVMITDGTDRGGWIRNDKLE
jgi:curli production assembly/transport component CsgG